MLVAAKKKSKCGLLAEFERSVPVGIAGVDIHNIRFVLHFNSRTLGFPAACRGVPGELERGWDFRQGSLSKTKCAPSSRTELNFKKQGWIWARPVARSTGHENHRCEPAGLSGKDIDHLLLDGGEAAAVEGGKYPANLEQD